MSLALHILGFPFPFLSPNPFHLPFLPFQLQNRGKGRGRRRVQGCCSLLVQPVDYRLWPGCHPRPSSYYSSCLLSFLAQPPPPLLPLIADLPSLHPPFLPLSVSLFSVSMFAVSFRSPPQPSLLFIFPQPVCLRVYAWCGRSESLCVFPFFPSFQKPLHYHSSHFYFPTLFLYLPFSTLPSFSIEQIPSPLSLNQ